MTMHRELIDRINMDWRLFFTDATTVSFCFYSIALPIVLIQLVTRIQIGIDRRRVTNSPALSPSTIFRRKRRKFSERQIPWYASSQRRQPLRRTWHIFGGTSLGTIMVAVGALFSSRSLDFHGQMPRFSVIYPDLPLAIYEEIAFICFLSLIICIGFLSLLPFSSSNQITTVRAKLSTSFAASAIISPCTFHLIFRT